MTSGIDQMTDNLIIHLSTTIMNDKHVPDYN